MSDSRAIVALFSHFPIVFSKASFLKVIKSRDCSVKGKLMENRFFFQQAEQHYATLAETEEHEGWQYFKRFKMNLYGNDVIVLQFFLFSFVPVV